jgi:hypothetical protein
MTSSSAIALPFKFSIHFISSYWFNFWFFIISFNFSKEGMVSRYFKTSYSCPISSRKAGYSFGFEQRKLG